MRTGTTELKGGSLILRRYVEEDIPSIHKNLGQNPAMLKYTGWNPYSTLEDTEHFIRNIIDGYDQASSDYSWVIEADGRIIGIIGAYDYSIEGNSIEIGYSIFQEYWGKGYATKAVAIVCEYLINHEKITVLKAWSASTNIGSVRALERNGFVETNTTEAGINVDGESFDQVFFEKKSGAVALTFLT